MADYWKSQPRKFCQYCKCWIADNKPSIEFHERGKNHKENVAAKIAEIKKKSVAKAKQEARMSKEFAAMEEAAQKAYEEDLKRMGMAADSTPKTLIRHMPLPMYPHIEEQPTAKKDIKKEKPSNQKSNTPTEAQAWVEGKSEEGHTYYYNSITGESRWDKPEGFHSGSTDSAQPVQNESASGSAWVEAVSPEGHTYYYNSETGESSWERPPDVAPQETGSGSHSSKEGESVAVIQGAATVTAGPRPAKEGSAARAPPKNTKKPSQHSKAPKICFRKRKVETDDAENEGAGKAWDRREKTKEESVVSQALKHEPEEKVVDKVKQAKKSKSTNPYGAWEQIQQEEDPYTQVDLQLPQVDDAPAAAAPLELPPEPKHKFKERIITSLQDEGGPAAFRKSKAHNGKSRSIRQRDDDD